MPKLNEPKLHKSQELLTYFHHPLSDSINIYSSSDPMPPFLSSSYPHFPLEVQTIYHIEQNPTRLLV